jgi:N-acetylglucosamine kinase-like BadF-type ATPase
MNDLLHRCYTPEFGRPRLAGFSVLVNHAAESGDPVALEVLHTAAGELASLAIAALRQLFGADDPTLVSYSGGVFGSRILLNRFRARMAAEPAVRLRPPAYGAAIGALLEAYRAVGLSIPGLRYSLHQSF